MKCPNCGLEIPEGHMYCDKCGTEINIVPEFDPQVQNEIDATLLGVADELNKEERLKRERKEKNKQKFEAVMRNKNLIMASCGVIALFIIGIIVYTSFFAKTPSYYMRLADSKKSSGEYQEAINYLNLAHREYPTNTSIIFRLSDYYLEMGDAESAVNTLLIITSSEGFTEDKIKSAYESIVSIYENNNEKDKIRTLFADSDNEIVASLKEKYVPEAPSFSAEAGTYQEAISIAISGDAESANTIYYTVNGDEPDSSSILYENEIVLDTEGTYNIKAVCVNDLDIPSAVTEMEYVIEKGLPADPEVMEPSGEYNQNTMIVVVAQAGTTIFYTTDGTDPDMESTQYISPITMPVGTSTFKFIAYDSEGNCSGIVERTYHLVYTRLVSTEQAVNNLVNTLVRLDILLDNAGKVRGQEGHNEYIYSSDIEIEGAGEYYVIVEYHVKNDGTRSATGLMYAVNTHDGTVNRLGYDSSGKYTLITISNR